MVTIIKKINLEYKYNQLATNNYNNNNTVIQIQREFKYSYGNCILYYLII